MSFSELLQMMWYGEEGVISPAAFLGQLVKLKPGLLIS